MKAIKSEFVGTDATGKDFWRVIVTSEEAIDETPTTGEGIDGVPDAAGIAAGSVFLSPDGNTVVYSDDFASGGGGGEGILSVTITPAIFSDPSLDTLAFPIYWSEAQAEGGIMNVTFDATATRALADEYIVKVTPSENWFAFNGEAVSNKGGALESTVKPFDGELYFRVAVMDTDNEDAATKVLGIDITIS